VSNGTDSESEEVPTLTATDTEKHNEAGSGSRRRTGLILVLLVAAVLVLGGRWWIKSLNLVTTDDAFIESTLHWVAPRVPGTVTKVLVNDNQLVRKGDLLVELDPADYQARVANQTAQLDLARNDTSSIYAQVEAAKAAVDSDRARLQQSELDLKRGESLFLKEVIPKEQFEKLETAHKVAVARLQETEGSVKRALALLGLMGNGAKDAQEAQKKALLDEAKLTLSYTKIYASVDGSITRKSVELGNIVQAGQPLMALVPLNNVWVTANYKERQLSHVKPGQPVEFTVDAYPGKTFHGTVDSIMAGTGAAFSLLPPENATGNYVKVVQRIPVKIRITQESDINLPFRVGMSVEPTIVLERSIGEIIRGMNPFR
jgi:membrane fusion protein, multidrug efflux system